MDWRRACLEVLGIFCVIVLHIGCSGLSGEADSLCAEGQKRIERNGTVQCRDESRAAQIISDGSTTDGGELGADTGPDDSECGDCPAGEVCRDGQCRPQDPAEQLRVELQEPSAEVLFGDSVRVRAHLNSGSEIFDSALIEIIGPKQQRLERVVESLPIEATFETEQINELGSGRAELTVTARSTRDTSASDRVPIEIDNSPPTVEIERPNPGVVVDDSLLAEVSVVDETTLKQINFVVDGDIKRSEKSLGTNEVNESFSVDISEIPGGEHTLTVRAADRFDQQKEKFVQFKKQVGTDVQLVSPSDGAVLNGSEFTVEIDAPVPSDYSLWAVDRALKIGFFDSDGRITWAPLSKTGVFHLGVRRGDSGEFVERIQVYRWKTSTFGSDRKDLFEEVTPKKTENAVFVGGWTKGDLPDLRRGGRRDGFAIEYPADTGGQSWSQLYGTSNVDGVSGIAAGADGGLAVGGFTNGSLENSSAPDTLAAFVKYEPRGTSNKAWFNQFDTGETDVTHGTAIGDDFVYLAGESRARSSANDAFLVAFSKSDGSKFKTKTVGETGVDEGAVGGVAIDSQRGAVYISGYVSGSTEGGEFNGGSKDAFVARYDTNLEQRRWLHLFGDAHAERASDVVVDSSSGSVYVVGNSDGDLSGSEDWDAKRIFVAKYGSDGTQKQVRTFGASGGAAKSYAADVGSRGHVYVAGSTKGDMGSREYSGGEGSDAVVLKLDPDLSTEWVQLLGTEADDAARGVAFTERTGQIYVVGETAGPLGGQSGAGLKDGFIAKY